MKAWNKFYLESDFFKYIFTIFSFMVLCFFMKLWKRDPEQFWHAFCALGITLEVSILFLHAFLISPPTPRKAPYRNETSYMDNSLFFLFFFVATHYLLPIFGSFPPSQSAFPKIGPDTCFSILLCNKGIVMRLRLSQSKTPWWDMDSGVTPRFRPSTESI